MSDVTFRLATTADAAELAVFAREVFVRTFGPDNDPEDLAGYVDVAFGEDVQRGEIESADAFTLLAIDDAGRIAAFAYVAAGPPDTVEVEQEPYQIKRFYVAYEHHGRGLAKRLMQEVFDRARALGGRTIWLGVWERNERAIAFYQKLGFVQAGAHSFLLGSDLQSDWVMQNTTALR